MKNFIFIVLFLGMILMLAACRKLVEIDTPKNQLTSDKVFADSTNADAAIIGIYHSFMNGQTTVSFSTTTTRALAADELTTALTGDQQAFFANNILIGNSLNNSLWSNSYKQIYTTNAIIDGVNASKGINNTAKAKLIGEAKCIRAYLYYQLYYFFGGVPIVTGTDYDENSRTPRANDQQVFDQIISDLKDAQASLPENNFVRWRANFYAATGMLARAYLSTNNYKAATEEASKVILSGKFPLQSDLSKVFTADNPEGIWSLIPVFNGRETWEAVAFVPTSTSARPAYIITPQLLNSYNVLDKRPVNWINKNTVGGQAYSYPYKYKKTTRTGTPTEHYLLLRSAEIYLIAADAAVGSGDLSSALANLNLIRRRAGLTDFVSTNVEEIRDEILNQRKLELFCEQGARWIDLKRTGKINGVLAPIKAGWTTTDQLFPIPKSQMDVNPFLVQNAGY